MDRINGQEQTDEEVPWLSIFAFFLAYLIFWEVVSVLVAHPFMINDEQKNLAEKVAQDDLRDEVGEYDINYEVNVQSYGEVIYTEEKGDTKVVRVKLTQRNGERIIYIFIDLDTGKVAKKIKTTKTQEEYDKTITCC